MRKLLPQDVITKDQLLMEIAQTKNAMDAAFINFQNVVDPDLIDSYIYEVNAAQKRYKFLLKQAKLLETVPEEEEEYLNAIPQI